MKSIIVAGALVLASAGLFASGADTYKACASCHGAKGEKAALGASKVISSMSKDDIAKALKGYKTDTYGGAKKAIMKGQVAKLNDTQIDELASYIATLK